jgi:tetratricopeptide (TPR) repeat protein
LAEAVAAYRQALEVYTRTDLPQDWAMTQNNLGIALMDQGERTAGEGGTQLLAEAVAAYRQALEVRTRTALPQQWATTQNNLAKALLLLQDWPNAAISYVNVLRVYPDDREAYQTASYLYHERLFQFPEAFTLNQQWLERHPDDLAALSDFAEKHFTTGRFAECNQRLVALLANPDVEPQVSVALRAIEIASLLALDNAAMVPGNIDNMLETIGQQPEDFKVTWSFQGTRYFISEHVHLAPYRDWLQQFLSAFTDTDRQAMVTGLRAARTTFRAVVK